MSSLVSDPEIAHRCNWPSSLKEFSGSLARSGSQARYSSMWPRLSTPFGLTALSTNSWSLTSPLTWWKPFYPICEVGRSNHSFKRLHLLAVACGLAWRRGINVPCPVQSVFQWQVHLLPPRRASSAVIATSRRPALESYLANLERWLREWRFAINVSKSTAMLFTRRRIHNSRPVLWGEPIIWVEKLVIWEWPLING